ncbi:MAG: acylphosphatase [Methanomassiliicoccales archaeon]
MKARAEARFTGRVQGVFFRDYTRRFSQELGLTGWVRNRRDGSVQAVFEGEEADIQEVIRRLREEHPHALVQEVQVDWKEPLDEFQEFKVTY